MKLMTREWEIARHYVLNVEKQNGEVNLNWEYFMMMARDHRPVAAVDVSDALTPGQLFIKAYDEAAPLLKHRPSGMIINVVNTDDNPLMMHDLNDLSQSIEAYMGKEQQFSWGITHAKNDAVSQLPDMPAESAHNRRLMLYLFE